jgi:DNA-binding ferritin-like protein
MTNEVIFIVLSSRFSAHDMLQEAFANHERVIQELRQAIKITDAK